ncbi:MAG: hypothetical protein ACRDV4_01390 [Acidimicrobiales bacterium]
MIEHVTDLSRSAPIFLLCIGRPELMERRQGWGARLNAANFLLEPLNEEEADALIDELMGPSEHLAPELQAKVRDAAGGNPLFVEEMLSLVTDSAAGDEDLDVPPTMHALLAARLDQLESPERHVLECGAVEGQSFHRRAVQALIPEDAGVPIRLVGLVRKDLIRPDLPTLPSDDAFRFRHLLIRDAAYDGLAKSVRAELHERLATWLPEAAPDLVELDEIVGYHLEQAVKYRTELGPPDETAGDLAARACARLQAAGQRALDRGDVPASLNLLERAAALLPAGQLDVALELAIVGPLSSSGRLDAAVARARAAAGYAAARGDRLGELKAQLVAAIWSIQVDTERAIEELRVVVEEASGELESSADDAGLSYLWYAVMIYEHMCCRFGSAFDAAEQVVRHAEAAGLRPLARTGREYASVAAMAGPMPVQEAVACIESLQDSTPFYEPGHDESKAELLALAGHFQEARILVGRALAALGERGETVRIAENGMGEWAIEDAAGDHVRAERAARATYEEFEQMGERAFSSTTACYLAESLCRLARYEEAETWARRGLELGASDDIATQVGAAQVLAKLSARRGERDEARAMARRAVELAESTESPMMRGRALLDLAEVHHLVGDDLVARTCAQVAVQQFELKGATAFAERARLWLSELGLELTE